MRSVRRNALHAWKDAGTDAETGAQLQRCEREGCGAERRKEGGARNGWRFRTSPAHKWRGFVPCAGKREAFTRARGGADAEAQRLREQAEKVERESVGRAIRSGLTDAAAAKRLGMMREKVTKYRGELGLPENPKGGAGA